MRESVLLHLGKMLNSKHGHALAMPDYGLPDFSELVHGLPDTVGDMQRAIASSIERFEPRLTQVRVRFAPDSEDVFNLHFEISAKLVEGGAAIWFETRVDDAGRILLRG